MAIVGLETAKDPKAAGCFAKIVLKSASEEGMVKNPFNISHKLKVLEDKLFFVLDIEPVYPPVFLFGFILLIPFIIFKWFNFWLIAPLGLISIGFFWSDSFFIIMNIIALKKNGYKGEVKILTKTKIIKRLIDNGSD